jgi:hypothetical protein
MDNESPKSNDKQTAQTPKVAKRNIVHPIRDVLGKDDNVNFIKNVIDTDITDKWAFDAYPLQLVLDIGNPPKEIDYIRITSENEQPYKLEFSNDNTATGYSKGKSGTLKRGLNDIEVSGTVARYARFEFTGNKSEDKNKDNKADPLGIYYVVIGQGEKSKSPLPVPGPVTTLPPPVEEPPKPTEGRIKVNNDTNVKGWGADYEKGAAKWQVVKMKNDSRLYKVVDAKGVNVADFFKSPESAETFITWYKWKQGPKADETGENKPDPDPEPGTGGGGTGGNGGTDGGSGTEGKGVDKYGVKLLAADGSAIDYDVEKDTRGDKKDGIRWNWKLDGAKQSEATGYFRFTKDPVDDEVSVKWSEKSHSGSNDVQCYDSGISIKSGEARIRFENPHPDYTKELGGTNSGGIPLGTKWVGYKGIKRVNTDGTVTIELYQDQGNNEGDKPANAWKKIFTYTDNKYKRTGAHPYVTIRVDDPKKQGQKNLEEKWLSAAVIK